jgi:hypothetical protein
MFFVRTGLILMILCTTDNSLVEIVNRYRKPKVRRAGQPRNTIAFTHYVFPGLTLEEMDEVFGDTTGLAKSDLERQEAINRRLGLLDAAVDKDKVSRSSQEVQDEK